MKALHTITITKMASLFTLLERNGTDLIALFNNTGIDPTIMESPDNRLTVDEVQRLTEKAEMLTGDRFLGLHQGEAFTTLSNILGYVMMNCSDLQEAIGKYLRYQRLVDEIVNTELIIQGDIAEMVYRAADLKYDTDMQMMDYRLSGCYMFFKHLTGKEIPLESVRFRHEKPSDIKEYQRVFKCNVLFSEQYNALVFRKDRLKTPVIQPNNKLLEIFEAHAAQILAGYLSVESCTHQVARLLVQSLNGSGITIEDTAKELGMSVRKLQNKLNEEGASFSELYDSIKKDMAIEYLKENETPISEITYILGFSEPSAFHRSFKRWTGHTPGAYRSMVQSGSVAL